MEGDDFIDNEDDSLFLAISERMDDLDDNKPESDTERRVSGTPLHNSSLTPLSPVPLTGRSSMIEKVKEKLRENTRRSLHLPLTPRPEETGVHDTSFFGLPSIVRRLLAMHRGITDLYGKFRSL